MSTTATRYMSLEERLNWVYTSRTSTGDWKVIETNKMEWGDKDVWTLDIPIAAPTFEFKFAVVNSTGFVVAWERGANRRADAFVSRLYQDAWKDHDEDHEWTFAYIHSPMNIGPHGNVSRCTRPGCSAGKFDWHSGYSGVSASGLAYYSP